MTYHSLQQFCSPLFPRYKEQVKTAMSHLTVNAQEIRSAVETNLASFLHDRREELAPIDGFISDVAEDIIAFVTGGGKRMRPLFAWTGFVAATGEQEPLERPEAVLRAVSALELIQACALIHDDIIDASETRRGKQTIHRRIADHHASHGWKGDPQRFGESMAILAGDLALVWADDLIAEACLSVEGLVRAWPVWARMRTEVIAGQMLDISVEAARDERPTSARKINELKTAAYTIERPLHFGAMLGGADQRLVDALREYGTDVGVAFQLRDDLLGVFGDSAVTGKPAGDDLREGKRTLLVAKALEYLDTHDQAGARQLREGLGEVTDPAAIAELADLIAGTDAVETVEEEISALTDKGLRAIRDVPLTRQASETLESLALAATVRHA
ncbi:polyprenyl synthetase family protein [Corynebacterium choanae]|uniref:Farnesyl diphosphate synthase n=1 Tax=Corynebacterium choanae TaxID=1862358 RepID=A0A3G6J770_9CORY|nr:polyprenyl synthetase family protein [Corynebacterium choanae]AZA13961.1 Farnesyl diphosphate synthase [Corynebacterium choanae]